LFFYFFLLLSLLSITNIYIVWLMMELIFLFFLVMVVSLEYKSIGLIIYFFFQRVISLFLFLALILFLDKVVFLLLCAKLGLFPFFYWIVIVRVKVGLWGNLFVLRFQKIRVFWFLWLVMDISLNFIYLLVYLSIFFVVMRLIFIRDLWLLIIYSSIANTAIIVLSSLGDKYMFIVFLYLFVIFFIIFIILKLDNFIEILLLVFLFIVIPPFVLFFIKFFAIVRLQFRIKLVFFLTIFDVFVLVYYFRLVFIKFLLLDVSVVVYLMNFILILGILFYRNCVTMIIFYKS